MPSIMAPSLARWRTRSAQTNYNKHTHILVEMCPIFTMLRHVIIELFHVAPRLALAKCLATEIVVNLPCSAPA